MVKSAYEDLYLWWGVFSGIFVKNIFYPGTFILLWLRDWGQLLDFWSVFKCEMCVCCIW